MRSHKRINLNKQSSATAAAHYDLVSQRENLRYDSKQSKAPWKSENANIFWKYNQASSIAIVGFIAGSLSVNWLFFLSSSRVGTPTSFGKADYTFSAMNETQLNLFRIVENLRTFDYTRELFGSFCLSTILLPMVRCQCFRSWLKWTHVGEAVESRKQENEGRSAETTNDTKKSDGPVIQNS